MLQKMPINLHVERHRVIWKGTARYIVQRPGKDVQTNIQVKEDSEHLQKCSDQTPLHDPAHVVEPQKASGRKCKDRVLSNPSHLQGTKQTQPCSTTDTSKEASPRSPQRQVHFDCAIDADGSESDNSETNESDDSETNEETWDPSRPLPTEKMTEKCDLSARLMLSGRFNKFPIVMDIMHVDVDTKGSGHILHTGIPQRQMQRHHAGGCQSCGKPQIRALRFCKDGCRCAEIHH